MVLPVNIQLGLTELNSLEMVQQDRATFLIRPGSVVSSDPNRAQTILNIVRPLFIALGDLVTIKLGNGAASNRFLKAEFSWNRDPNIGGLSAQGLSRTKLGPFTRKIKDQNDPVTGYIFEGAILGWIADIMGPHVSVNVNNIFSMVIAHELGHQLGLLHETQPDNIMFIWDNQPLTMQKQYLRLCSDLKLNFTKIQVKNMQEVIAKP